MKRLVVLSAIALLAGAGLLRLVQHDAGYVLIVIGSKSIEMRFWMAVLVLVVLAVVLYYLWRALQAVASKFSDLSWLSLRGSRQGRAQTRLRQGILRVFEGDYEEADRILKRVVKVLPNDPLALVASSESAIRMGHPQTARQRLQASETQAPQEALSIELAEVRTLISEGRLQQALAQLLVVKSRYKKRPAVLILLQDLLQKLEDWPALETLLPEIERSAAKDLLDWPTLQRRTYRELLLASSEAPEPLKQVDAVWTRVPKSLREDPQLLAVYCRLLIAYERYNPVADLLRKALKKTWSDELVELYGLLPGPDLKRQLRIAQSWLDAHPDDAGLHLCVGRIAMRNELWGTAKEHLERSLQLAPLPVTYAELARLLDHMGEIEQSLSLFRKGLLQATPAVVALPSNQGSTLTP